MADFREAVVPSSQLCIMTSIFELSSRLHYGTVKVSLSQAVDTWNGAHPRPLQATKNNSTINSDKITNMRAVIHFLRFTNSQTTLKGLRKRNSHQNNKTWRTQSSGVLCVCVQKTLKMSYMYWMMTTSAAQVYNS